MAKQLKDKAIKVDGKDYVQVKDRVISFNEDYKNGRITTKVVGDDGTEVIMRAIAIPDISNKERYFVGHATGVRGGKGADRASAIENAETSAVGRALGMMGIGVIDSIASTDEMSNHATKSAAKDVTEIRADKIVSGELKEKCERCGAPLKVSQAGKPYCSAICWEKKSVGDKKPISTEKPASIKTPEQLLKEESEKEELQDGLPF